MHRYDERTARIADAVFAYTRARLALEPVPLDRAIAAGRVSQALVPEPDPGRRQRPRAPCSRLYSEVLAPAVISCDSPRFLAFIPAAPTKAALLFDMIVSCASISGISWLESAGAVHAENQALRFLERPRRTPPARRGRVRAGWLGREPFGARRGAVNTRALAVATAAACWRIAVSEQTHSSVANTMRIIDVDPLDRARRRRPPHRCSFAAALEADGDPHSGVRGRRDGGHHQCRSRRRPRRHRRGVEPTASGCTTPHLRRCRFFLAPSVRARFAGIEHADSMIVDPHKWLYAPFDCAALLYRDPAFARSVHTQDASYLDVIHDDAHGWNPSDYAYQLTRRARHAALVLPRRQRFRRVPRRNRTCSTTARRGRGTCRRPPTSSWFANPSCRWCCSVAPDGPMPTTTRGRRGCSTSRSCFVAPTRWHGEPVARLAFLHPETTLDIVDEILATTV